MSLKNVLSSAKTLFSIMRDYSWLVHPDHAHRLYRGRKLLRDAVRAVYGDACIVDWSSPKAPYAGVMMRTKPVRILINPTAVLKHDGKHTQLLAMTLHGVALHEASHAVHTSPRFGQVLRQRQRRFEKNAGVTLAGSIIHVCANLCEDRYIEDRLTAEMPGFQVYFKAMRLYYFSDADCDEKQTQLQELWDEYRADPAGFTQGRALTTACMNVVLSRVNRPDYPLTLPTGTEVLQEAANIIAAAGRKKLISRRLDGAVEATAGLQEFFRQWEKSGAAGDGEGNDGEASSGDTALDKRIREAIERAVRDCDFKMRENEKPRGKSQVKVKGMTRRLLQALEEMEAVARQEEYAEETFTAKDLAVSAIWESKEGKALMDGKTVRIIDSDPETLPHYDADYDTVADILRQKHQSEAETLRQEFARLIRREREIREYGQRRGSVEDDALAELAVGLRDVFTQSHFETEHRLDLVLLLDESGSMNIPVGSAWTCRWKLAATAAILLEYALRPHFPGRRVRLRVFGFSSGIFSKEETVVFRHFDSALARLNRPQALGWSYGKANNCDGLALAALRREILRDRRPGQPVALLMISDGEPASSNYKGQAAFQHVRQEVDATVGAKVRFAHLQIGDTDAEIMNGMYRDRWQRVERAEDLPAKVVRLVGQWLITP